MKRILFLIMMAVAFTLPSVAQEFSYKHEGHTLTYTVIDEDQKCVSVKSPRMKPWDNLVIPEVVYYEDTPYTVTEIEDDGFKLCNGLKSVIIPESVTKIGDNAFLQNYDLIEVTLGDHILSIGNDAFRYCNNLTSIKIPDSLTMLGEAVFEDCSQLTMVVVGKSVEEIPDRTFRNCENLSSISLGNSLTSIGKGAFYFCKNLSSITIPESVTKIGENAFWGCTKLLDITIPGGITVIGNNTFFQCKSLKSVTFGNSLYKIGDQAFSVCDALTSVTLPPSLEIIGYQAFYDCKNLSSVTIPGSVFQFGKEAFGHNFNLKTIYYDTNHPRFVLYNFFNTSDVENDPQIVEYYQTATLYVPEHVLELTKQVHPWSQFRNIEPFVFSEVETVTSDFDQDLPLIIYGISGDKMNCSIETLPPGIYIIRQGKSVKKIVK